MATVEEFLISGMSLDRTYEGYAEVEWLSIANNVKVMRTVGRFSAGITDGVEVYSGAGTVAKCLDTTISEVPKVYYYTLFYEDVTWKSAPLLQRSIMMVEMGSFIEIVKDRLLPMLYRSGWNIQDSPKNLGALLSLVLIPPAEEIRNLIKAMRLLIDVDEAPPEMLVSLAKLVGLEPNLELSVKQQREEIKQAVSLWKRKGSVTAIELMATIVANQAVLVDEWGDNVLLTNMYNDDYPMTSPFYSRYNRVTGDPGNPDMGEPGMPGDQRSYTMEGLEVGNRYNFVDYGIFIPLLQGTGFVELQAKKLADKLEILTPLGNRGNVVFYGVQGDVGTITRDVEGFTIGIT